MAEAFLLHPGQDLYLENYTVKKKIAADHLIHLVIFTMSALLLPAPMMKTANSRTEAGREHPV